MKHFFKLLICLLTVAVSFAFTPSTAEAQFTLPGVGVNYEGVMGTPYLVYIGVDYFYVYPVIAIPGSNKKVTLEDGSSVGPNNPSPAGAFIDLGFTFYMMSAGGVGLTTSDMWACAGHQVVVNALGSKAGFGIAIYVIAGLI